MSKTNSDDCYLCGGSGEVEITPFGLPDDQCDSFGCPACVAAERDEEIAELRQQRDKLLAALECLTNDIQSLTEESDHVTFEPVGYLYTNLQSGEYHVSDADDDYRGPERALWCIEPVYRRTKGQS